MAMELVTDLLERMAVLEESVDDDGRVLMADVDLAILPVLLKLADLERFQAQAAVMREIGVDLAQKLARRAFEGLDHEVRDGI